VFPSHDRCDSGNVIIKNLKHYSIVTDDKPGDTIVVKNQTAGYSPSIAGESIVNTIKPSRGQDTSGDTLGNILNDTANSKTVPSNILYFLYGARYVNIGVNSPGDKPYLIGGGFSAPTINVSTGGVLAAGNTPIVGLYEEDASTDEKVFTWVMSAGNLTLRSVNDSGSADIALNILNTAGVVGEFEFKKNVKLEGASFSAANIPTYADNASAASGGLAVGRVYKTATGELRIVI